NLLYSDDRETFSELCNEFCSLPQEIKLYNDEYKTLHDLVESYIYFFNQEYLSALKVAEMIYKKIRKAQSHFFRHNEEFVLLFFKYYAELLFINKLFAQITQLLDTVSHHHFANERNLKQRDILIFLV